MNDLSTYLTAIVHTMYAAVRPSTPASTPAHPHERDRGAISLEQVLWFVAAGVSVAVIAAILWNQIRDQANTPVSPPSAP